jgi:phage-related protein
MAFKPVEFRGNALDELRSFPEVARRAAGFQIDRLQRGYDPEDWKPMPSVGKGVREVRIRDEAGAFRVIYLTKLEDAVSHLSGRFHSRIIWLSTGSSEKCSSASNTSLSS